MSLHHNDGSLMDAFPPHFLSLSLAPPNFQHQVNQTHLLSNVPSVTVTPVSLPTQQSTTGHSSLKGIVLPTQPLPPEEALGEDFLATIQLKDAKPKRVKSENSSEAVFVKCEHCDYSCDKKDRLSRHVRIVHYKEKPFSCNLCEYSTGRKDKLKRHQATVHSQERPFKCEYCPHTSSRKDKLREHIQGVHFKNRPKRPKKKYPKKKKTQQMAQLPHQTIQMQAHQQQQHQQVLPHQSHLIQQQATHQIVVSQQHQTNGGLTHVLTTSGGLPGVTVTQLPVSLVPVSVSAADLPPHYQIKPHQAHHILS